MNVEDQEVPIYNEYLKHGEYRVDASKSEKRAIRRRAHSFVMKEGLLYLKSNTADMTEKQWIVNKEDQMKWPEAQALPIKSAENVAHVLLSLITRFGCFSVCISDQGHEFVNALNDKRFEMAGIEDRVSSAYHPQTNNLDEQMNQTVTKAIVKYLNLE
ncbi:hypothetical protein EMCRGX_G012230 [Ephydatia muelleri]